MVGATLQLKMLLLPVWASMLFMGFLSVVGMEPTEGDKSDSDYPPNTEPPPSSSGSNCSEMTLKLEFKTKTVEHGKNMFVKLVDML